MRHDESNWTPGGMPTKKPKSQRWEIFRAKEKGQTRLVVISRQHVNVRTHWVKGRQQPCLKEGCEECLAGKEARWTGFLLAQEYNTLARRLVQFTDNDCMELLTIEATYGNIRGCVINIFRTAKRSNGPVSIRVEASKITEERLLPDEDINPILARMWEVKEKVIPETQVTPLQLEVARQVAEQVTEQIQLSADAAWMLPRATDLAGQRALPLEVSDRLAKTFKHVNGG